VSIFKKIKHYARKASISKRKMLGIESIVDYKNNAWKSKVAASHYKKVVELALFKRLVFPIFTDNLRHQLKILDVGCGTGRLTKSLLESGHKVTATDISTSMLNLIEEHVNLTKESCDSHQLIFPDKSFDAVVSLDFISHFPTWKRLLKEQIRVLSDSGVLICNYLTAENALMKNDRFDNKNTNPIAVSETATAISKLELETLCNDMNCTLLKIVPYGFLWGNDFYSGFMSSKDGKNISNLFLKNFTNNVHYADRVVELDRVISQTSNPLLSSRAVMVIEKNRDDRK
jgi:2-polyprenyl-3-methyl-5-hydroxy-6-metoxy-1,4-benzoquinol methylase